jgi:predicted  nucleic acid-binding Zn-ribbon protein
MAIRDIANVDPDAVRSMHKKIAQLKLDLETISKKIKNNVDSLNREGFQDLKFKELQTTLNTHNTSMLELQRFMDRYTIYLQEQERILRRYIDTKKL